MQRFRSRQLAFIPLIVLGSTALGLILLAYLLGDEVLRRVVVEAAEIRGSDRFFIAAWLGLLLIGGLLAGASLLAPLDGRWVAVFALSLAVLLAVRLRRSGSRFSTKPEVSAFMLGFSTLVFATALYASKDISFYDTGVHHLPHIVALGEHGTVPGMSLVHHRFGYGSSWFALTAPFVALFEGGRLTAIGGTLAFSLLVGQFSLSAARALYGSALPADGYMIVAVPVALVMRPTLAMVPSATPDLPALSVVLLVIWALLLQDSGELHAPIAMLATGAVALKLSVAPLLLCAALVMLWPRRQIRQWNGPAVFGICTIGTVAASNFLASGCFAFPAPFTCLSVPWGVGSEVASVVSAFISDAPLMNGMPPNLSEVIKALMEGTRRPMDTLGHLRAIQQRYGLWVYVVPALGIGAVLWQAVRHGGRSLSIAALSVLFGLVFTLQAPLERFAVPWLAALAALVVISFGQELHLAGRRPRIRVPMSVCIAATLIAASMASTVLAAHRSRGDKSLVRGPFPGRPTPLTARLVWPSTIVARQPPAGYRVLSRAMVEPANFVTQSIHGVVFLRPERGEQCWLASFPCVPNGEPLQEFTYRRGTDPASGFVRVSTD